MLNFADVNFRISFVFKLLAEKYYSKGAGHQRDVLSNCLSYFWSITKYNPLWLLTLKCVGGSLALTYEYGFDFHFCSRLPS